MDVASRTERATLLLGRLIETVAWRLQLELVDPPIDPGFHVEFLFDQSGTRPVCGVQATAFQ